MCMLEEGLLKVGVHSFNLLCVGPVFRKFHVKEWAE